MANNEFVTYLSPRYSCKNSRLIQYWDFSDRYENETRKFSAREKIDEIIYEVSYIREESRIDKSWKGKIKDKGTKDITDFSEERGSRARGKDFHEKMDRCKNNYSNVKQFFDDVDKTQNLDLRGNGSEYLGILWDQWTGRTPWLQVNSIIWGGDSCE